MVIFFNILKPQKSSPAHVAKATLKQGTRGQRRQTMKLATIKTNQNGVIFITVLMIIIALAAVAVTIISLNVSQISTTEDEVKRIQAEMLSMGAIAYTFADRQGGGTADTITLDEQLDGVAFPVEVTVATGAPTGPNNTRALNINADY